MSDRCKKCGEGWWINDVCQMCNYELVIDVAEEEEVAKWGL